MKPKKFLISTVAFLGILGFASFIEAGHDYVYYDTTVGRFNGNGYSDVQTKSVAGQKADVSHLSNGGYNVDIRTTSSGSNGTWARNVKAGDVRQLTNGHNKGTQTRLQFSNDLTTRVDTQSRGYWRSN